MGYKARFVRTISEKPEIKYILPEGNDSVS